jgi:hypothetical protein
MIVIESKGDFEKTRRWLDRLRRGEIFKALNSYGAEGVSALQAATPKDTGVTSTAWSYQVIHEKGSWSIVWSNSQTVIGKPLVIMLQYGHGTGTGGYVKGRDFINPAMRPIFDRIANDVWKAVTSA